MRAIIKKKLAAGDGCWNLIAIGPLRIGFPARLPSDHFQW